MDSWPIARIDTMVVPKGGSRSGSVNIFYQVLISIQIGGASLGSTKKITEFAAERRIRMSDRASFCTDPAALHRHQDTCWRLGYRRTQRHQGCKQKSSELVMVTGEVF